MFKDVKRRRHLSSIGCLLHVRGIEYVNRSDLQVLLLNRPIHSNNVMMKMT